MRRQTEEIGRKVRFGNLEEVGPGEHEGGVELAGGEVEETGEGAGAVGAVTPAGGHGNIESRKLGRL